MRRWWREAVAAADTVTDRPQLWLPGALAWALTVGWIPLLLVVARPPTVADLTFLGARFYTSSAWPWNAIVAGTGVLLVATTAFVFGALAETILVGGGRRAPSVARLARAVSIGVVGALPAIAALLVTATAFLIMALDEFTSPGQGDPLLRTVIRVAPFIGITALGWIVGGLLHAAALRAVVQRDDGIAAALAAAPGRLRRAGWPVLVGAVATLAARLAYLVVTTVLLGVLWASLRVRLGTGGFDPALVPLLVGFVAIWLCLVLGGGALHAWSSLTWTGVLGRRLAAPGGAERRAHGDPHRP